MQNRAWVIFLCLLSRIYGVMHRRNALREVGRRTLRSRWNGRLLHAAPQGHSFSSQCT